MYPGRDGLVRDVKNEIVTENAVRNCLSWPIQKLVLIHPENNNDSLENINLDDKIVNLSNSTENALNRTTWRECLIQMTHKMIESTHTSLSFGKVIRLLQCG